MTAVIVRPGAHQDVADAVEWYMAVAPEVANGLIEEYDQALGRIAQFPLLCAIEYRNVRMAPLRRFPYLVWYVYEEDADAAIVLRVTHQAQDDVAVKQRLPDV